MADSAASISLLNAAAAVTLRSAYQRAAASASWRASSIYSSSRVTAGCMDATTRLRPGNRRGRTGVDSIEPRANLGRPRRFSVGVSFAFETLNQLARERGSLFIRKSKSFYQELLGVHTGHYGPFTMEFDPREDYDSRDDERLGATGHRRGGSDDDRNWDDWRRPEIASRGRNNDARELGRGPGDDSRKSNSDARGQDPRDEATWADRERGHDPRHAFRRGLDLPRGREREIVRDRDREYRLRGSESRTLATVGAFRVVSSRDLRDNRDRPLDPRSSDLRHLRELGLVEVTRIAGSRDYAVSLTRDGRSLLESHRDRDREGSQTFYAGVKRERELEHDVQVYRAFEREAERLEGRGARIDRVILDYELKRDYQKWLHERDRDRETTTATPIATHTRSRNGPANTTCRTSISRSIFADARLEYEDADGRWDHVDVEAVTVHYRGAHGAAAARSGFSCYGGSSARAGGNSCLGGLAEEMLR
jgi:hypothetical protein